MILMLIVNTSDTTGDINNNGQFSHVMTFDIIDARLDLTHMSMHISNLAKALLQLIHHSYGVVNP